MTQTIQTSGGRVRGIETADGVLTWRGIPYAAPPVGPLRWQLPQPAGPWTEVRDGSRPGNPAMQPPPPMPEGLPGAMDPVGPELPPPSEDCLYLNVTAPADARQAPVVVWVHGGGYSTGSGFDMVGDGVAFARDHGAVVVSFNYRLGAFGFLSLLGEKHTGAYGTHDQIAALRWVHDNIAAFGGDPARVTAYGLSAGAKSISNLMASPLTRGLIQQAASSSGGDHVASPDQSRALAARLRKELGADPERLRDIPAVDLLQAQNAIAQGPHATWVWRPAIDGLAIPRRPTEAIVDGAAAGIPLLAQHCVRECLLYQLGAPDSAAQADRVLEECFGPEGRDEILAAYAASAPGEDPTDLRVDIMTAERYAIPTTRLADAQSAHAPVWRSRYDGPLTGVPPQFAAGGELPALHGTDGSVIWHGGTGVDGQLHAAWGAFVTTGTPATPQVPEWPRYVLPSRSTMVFGSTGTRLESDPDAARRAAWEGRDWQAGVWYPIDGVF
ncbi:carboxylesterase/lipase family protein [Streptomyces sp. NPDC057555]|uniref:carboxylesterase/lipase family protein n=1 Tax=Streptomyces sp. NPDC057555 TaxID=3346166 RepID=UPI00368F0040